ncbi:MAG: NAD(P)H-hydrate dehydratase, partial [Verrucomicrobia bacterium]|nr:NAD(P)H-hydrate dehydratase [Verrucomicrobiota bacterium]
MSALPASDPILSCAEARAFEAARFGGDEALEWPAMQRAGRALAAAVLRDFLEIGGFPPAEGRVLVLAGKGHNAGDALLAAGELLKDFPGATVDVLFVFGERALRPLAA